MILYPAIDLKDGLCVRLKQGDFNQATVYESDPLKVAHKFKEAGAEWLHMVDLDGAKAGEMHQIALIEKVTKESGLKVQTGGGIRSEKTVRHLLDSGVSRVVVGSLAVRNKSLVLGWLREFGGDKIALAFDIRYHDGEPEILTQGWQSGSQQLLWDTLEAYAGSGVTTVLCTDVGRDGMLEGANRALYTEMREKFPSVGVLASGGVSTVEELVDLAQIGAAGAVVGKAIYEGRINLKYAIEQVRGVCE